MPTTQTLDHDAPEKPNRRAMFTGGAVLATATVAVGAAVSANAAAMRYSDSDILNFALNLEYLEAEYYARGVTGVTLDQTMSTTLGGQVRGGRKVTFSTPARRAFLEDVARNEVAHVNFLRTAVDTPVARATIDFSAGFAAVAQAAGLGAGFDPFADETSFYLGAMLFEDVGVTAYKGASPLLKSRKILTAAAGILAVEAYHAGVVRSVLYKMGSQAQDGAKRISDLRDLLDGPEMLDQAISIGGQANIVPANENSIAFSRTTAHVLNIAFANPSVGITMGGFFPEGINGRINAT